MAYVRAAGRALISATPPTLLPCGRGGPHAYLYEEARRDHRHIVRLMVLVCKILARQLGEAIRLPCCGDAIAHLSFTAQRTSRAWRVVPCRDANPRLNRWAAGGRKDCVASFRPHGERP